MEVTHTTWVVAVAGWALMGLLLVLQTIALVRPRAPWTVQNVYGGAPTDTDPKAYFAFNQGFAWADVGFWGPLQLLGGLGLVLGARWGFLVAALASVPYCYTAIQIFVWDRDLKIRRPTVGYWVVVWGMWPAFGLVQAVYCSARLLT